MSKLPKSFVHLSNIKTNPLIKEGFIVFQIVPKRGVRFRHFPQGRGGKIGGLFLKGEGGYPVTYFYIANLSFAEMGVVYFASLHHISQYFLCFRKRT